jgi:hypothetical protein
MKISAKEIIETVITQTNSLLIPDQIVRIDYVQSDDQVDTDGNKDFPRIYFNWSDAGTLEENFNTITLDFLFCDVMASKTNSKKYDYEIKSDMMQAASKLFDNLSREEFFQNANPTFTYNPFSNRFNNGMSGVEVSVTFVVSKPCFDV